MRLVVWNCKDGLGSCGKPQFINSLRPDIAVFPELRKNDFQVLQAENHLWITNNHTHPNPKGLGILTFNGYQAFPHERDEEMELYLPVKVTKAEFSFNLLAVWNFYYASKNGRFRGIKGDGAVAYEALRFHRDFLSTPAIVAGDFNFGPTFANESYLKYCQMLTELDIYCAYRKQYGVSAPPPLTFRHRNGRSFHCLDHIFASKALLNSLKSVEVLDFTKVVKSDHAPMIAEFEGFSLRK